jgi:hypothetical protein
MHDRSRIVQTAGSDVPAQREIAVRRNLDRGAPIGLENSCRRRGLLELMGGKLHFQASNPGTFTHQKAARADQRQKQRDGRGQKKASPRFGPRRGSPGLIENAVAIKIWPRSSGPITASQPPARRFSFPIHP